MVEIRIFILFVLFVSFSTREKRDEFFFLKRKRRTRLTAEAVQGLALSLQRVDDIHGGDRLSSGVFGVRHRITDNVFQEHLQDTSGFFVDKTRDSLDTTSSGKSADSRLGDTLDIVSQDFSMTLGATFA